MQLLEGVVLPIVFLTSTLSTRPVIPSKYRGVWSVTSCLLTVLLGVIFSVQMSSKIALLYVVLVFPVIMGMIPTEEKFKKSLIRTRVWGITYAYIARLHGNNMYVKLYLWTEKSVRSVHLQLGNTYVTINQFLFLSLARKVLQPQVHNGYDTLIHIFMIYTVRFLKTRQWVKLTLLVAASQLLSLVTLSYSHPAVVALYLGLTSYQGVPGKDTREASVVRRLGLSALEGVEEYWVPLLLNAAPIVLSALLVLTAMQDFSTWVLCSWVWYSNVFVGVLQTAEWYWTPLAGHFAHKAQYPSSSRMERDWRGKCPICWEPMRPFTAQSTNCGHIFHAQCLHKSAETTNDTCPVCRYPLQTPGITTDH